MLRSYDEKAHMHEVLHKRHNLFGVPERVGKSSSNFQVKKLSKCHCSYVLLQFVKEDKKEIKEFVINSSLPQ